MRFSLHHLPLIHPPLAYACRGCRVSPLGITMLSSYEELFWHLVTHRLVGDEVDEELLEDVAYEAEVDLREKLVSQAMFFSRISGLRIDA